jgi:hypothetical protein
MDIVACAGSFFLGGVAAATFMGLLLLFIENPLRKTRDDQYLQEIANALLPLTECKSATEILKGSDAEALEVQQSQPANDQFSPDQIKAGGRWGKECIPVCELLQ